MKDQNCGYCMRGELLDEFGIFICDLDVSSLILFKEQSHPGRCIVAYKDHVSEIVNISECVFRRRKPCGEGDSRGIPSGQSKLWSLRRYRLPSAYASGSEV